MAIFVPPPRTWSCSVDKEGVRTYKVVFRVEVTSSLVGPAQVRLAPGLPFPGQYWAFGTDLDIWAWCTQEREVTPVQPREGQPVQYYDVTCVFSTRTPKKCQDEKFENPLLELPTISGNSVRYTEEARFDRFGRPIKNSAHEPLKGRTVEFDANRPTIKIKFNVGTFNTISLAYSMQDRLNSVPLWGLPPRYVKLSGVNFEKKYFGLCFGYYELDLEFDIANSQRGGRAGSTTFDRLVADEGMKALLGKFNSEGVYVVENVNGQPPNPANPLHFQASKDPKGENIKFILDGAGMPYAPVLDLVTATCGASTRVHRYYKVLGFESLQTTTPVTSTNRPPEIVLTKVAGVCTWTGTYSDTTDRTQTVTLTYNTANIRWELTNTQTPGDVWFTPRDEWGPESENLMDTGPLLPQNVGPSTIVVEPSTAPDSKPPGSIFIQKYDEANFLLLGIPLVL